jgi:hypothetical protein
VRIGTRITLTTSALVAVTLGVYGYVTLRSRRSEREAQLERQARDLATTMRVMIETRRERADGGEEPVISPAEWQELTQKLGKTAPWRVEFVPQTPSGDPPGEPDLDRFRRMVAVRAAVAEKTMVDGRETYVLLEPVREPAPTTINAEGSRIVGAVQVSRDIAALGSGLDE